MPDQKSTGVEIHKDFVFSNAWKKFKVIIQYFVKILCNIQIANTISLNLKNTSLKFIGCSFKGQ